MRRFERGGQWLGDQIHDESDPVDPGWEAIDPFDGTRRKRFPGDAVPRELLTRVFDGGTRVRAAEDLETIRARVRAQLAGLDAGVKRFRNPHRYPAGLAAPLHRTRARLIAEAKGFDEPAG